MATVRYIMVEILWYFESVNSHYKQILPWKLEKLLCFILFQILAFFILLEVGIIIFVVYVTTKFLFSTLIVYAFGTCLQTFSTDINVLCIFSVLGTLRFGECFSCLTLSLISGFKVFSRLIWIIGFHMIC